jgi:hypothetical protein
VVIRDSKKSSPHLPHKSNFREGRMLRTNVQGSFALASISLLPP